MNICQCVDVQRFCGSAPTRHESQFFSFYSAEIKLPLCESYGNFHILYYKLAKMIHYDLNVH